MTTISPHAAHAAEFGLERRSVSRNPLRRGPVVLATDGSSATGAPVMAALLLAERLQVPLSIVAVLEPLPTFAASVDVVVPLDPAVDERRIRACETTVRDYVGRFTGGAAPSRVHVRFGTVATEIARFAREVSATIVVMGSSPRRRFHHTVSAQQVAHVLHHGPCPVLSVPPTFRDLPKVVVAAVDFGPASTRAAKAAMLIVADGGSVILTHVHPPPVRPDWLRIVSDQELAVNIHALFDLILEEVAPCVPDGVNVETRSVAGDTVEAIISSAAQLGSVAIAVGTHGTGLIARGIVGGTAERVLRDAEQVVLAAPPPATYDRHTLTRRSGQGWRLERTGGREGESS